MRIIGGELKGRLIEPPHSLRARPTTDFAREGLFNILNNRFDFSAVSVLDLFSGSGAISFEFASRGTRDIDLVEIDSRHCLFISKTLRALDIKGVRVHRMSVSKWLEICKKKYDIIFADPPYDLPWLQQLPQMVLDSVATGENTVFILEHPRKIKFDSNEAFSEHRHYGNVNFTFFVKR